MNDISERDGNGRRGELKPLRLVKGHAGSIPAVRTIFKTEGEKTAYQSGWNDGFDAAMNHGGLAKANSRAAPRERSEHGTDGKEESR